MPHAPSRRVVIAGLATLALPLPGARAAAPFAARYRLAVGGFSAAEAALEVRREGDRYAARGTMTAAGLLDWLFAAAAEAEAEGRLIGPDCAPERFAADARFGADRYRLSMDFEDGPRVEAEPPLRERWYDPAPEALRGALDPLSAAVALCLPTPVDAAGRRSVAIYDARRRVDLEIGAVEPAGDRLRAGARMRRVAGFKDKHLRRPPHPLTLWWDREDGAAVLARVQTATPLGAAVVTREA